MDIWSRRSWLKDVVNLSLLQDHEQFSDYYYKYVRDQSYYVLLDLAKLNVSLGNHLVILDGYFVDKLHKEPFASFLKSNDFEVKVIYLTCSQEVNKERIIARAHPRDDEKLKIFEKYYDDSIALADDILTNIPHLKIDTEDSIEVNLMKIISYLED